MRGWRAGTDWDRRLPTQSNRGDGSRSARGNEDENEKRRCWYLLGIGVGGAAGAARAITSGGGEGAGGEGGDRGGIEPPAPAASGPRGVAGGGEGVVVRDGVLRGAAAEQRAGEAGADEGRW